MCPSSLWFKTKMTDTIYSLVLASSEDHDTSVRYNEFSASLCFVKCLRVTLSMLQNKMSFVSSVAVHDHKVDVIGLKMVCSSVIAISTVDWPLLGIMIYSANH